MRDSFRKLSCHVVLLVLALSFPTYAFENALYEADKLLDKGELDAAISVLKEAQVDFPNAPELRFGIACALFLKGEQLMSTGQADQGRVAFSEALSLFNELALDKNLKIAREATFNSGNTIAREGLLVAQSGDVAGGINVLRRAVAAYESGLEKYPDHEGMRTNLDHVRLKLKELLQSPPPEQKQPDKQPPQEQPQSILSRFGQASTDVPGAQAKVEENAAIFVPPEKVEGAP